MDCDYCGTLIRIRQGHVPRSATHINVDQIPVAHYFCNTRCKRAWIDGESTGVFPEVRAQVKQPRKTGLFKKWKEYFSRDDLDFTDM